MNLWLLVALSRRGRSTLLRVKRQTKSPRPERPSGATKGGYFVFNLRLSTKPRYLGLTAFRRGVELPVPEMVRTSNYFSGDPLALAEPARRAVASIDPQQAVGDITSLAILSDESIAGQRTSALVTAILGCLALLLASIGVYGVMA
jgi:hypothetical protein